MFIVLLFVFALPFWILDALVDTPPGMPIDLPLSALMVPAPMAAAAIVTYRRHGTRDVRDLLRRTVDPRRVRPRLMYLPIVAIVPVMYALTYAGMVTGGVSTAGPRTPLTAVPVLCVAFMIAGVAEEAGWTGYALEPLRRRFGDLRAGLLIGFAWATWHLVPLIQVHRLPWWIVFWFAGTVLVRTIMVWCYDRSGGAVIGSVIIHALLNVAEALLPAFTTRLAPIAIQTGVYALVAVALWTFGTRRRSGGKRVPSLHEEPSAGYGRPIPASVHDTDPLTG